MRRFVGIPLTAESGGEPSVIREPYVALWRSRCVLGFSVAEGPVFFCHFHQADEDIFPAQLQALVQAVGHGFIEPLLHLHGSTAIQRDLYKDAVVGSMNAKKFPVKLQAGLGMLGDDLEEIVLSGRSSHRSTRGR